MKLNYSNNKEPELSSIFLVNNWMKRLGVVGMVLSLVFFAAGFVGETSIPVLRELALWMSDIAHEGLLFLAGVLMYLSGVISDLGRIVKTSSIDPN